MQSRINYSIPKEVLVVAQALQGAGFKAYLVGGCVRDILLKREPKDWDVTTNALPEEIQKIFPDSVYENNFGTVGIKTNSVDKKLAIVEVTTFREEGKYEDFRHPLEIKFAKNVEDDLGRRDFTVNAMAQDIDEPGNTVDPYDGQADLKAELIRAVGSPEERFREDALRLMRAVRFAAELGFQIEPKTTEAIKNSADLLEHIAQERIRDEFVKIIMAPGNGAAWGVVMLEQLGLLKNIVPELREGIAVGQNKHHIYTVWDHNLRALDYSAGKGYSFEVRLASLLHDVGKPKTKVGDGPDSSFHGHEVVGGRMTRKIMERLRFSKEISEKVTHLVRHHLFYYNVGEVTEAGVRRFIARVGPENIDDLFKVREADRIGSGVPKAVPYKARHLQFMIEKVKSDPVSPKMLKVNGTDIMAVLKMEPTPKIGWILGALLEEVLDDPAKNTKKFLEERIWELNNLSDKELKEISEKAKEKKEEFESGIEDEMKKKYYVK
ncbi:MAG TPA: HD domain-containing protein [Candidatus Paceibacterota bacterium]|nr:HD domain-containing protein [Candidatus Paceibacterota bacterium]